MKIILLMILSLSLWANIGTIMSIKGSADVKREHNVSLAASSGMELLKGDEIITHNKSRVQVMLQDDTVVTIGQNSSFGFEDFAFDGTKNSKLSMKATRGFFRSVTGKLGKVAPERFKVKTASATIGIRGTDFSGNIIGEAQTFVCYSGAISVEFDGAVSNIDAGMVMQIVKNKVEIKKIEIKPAKKVQKVEKKLEKKSEKTTKDAKAVKESVEKAVDKAVEKVEPKTVEVVESVVEAVVDSVENLDSIEIEEFEQIAVPEEIVSQITQVIEEEVSSGRIIVEEPVVEGEPLEVTPNVEDRETQY